MTPEERRIYRARIGYTEEDDWTLLWAIIRPVAWIVLILAMFLVGLIVMAL